MNNEIEQLLIQLEYFIEENYKYYNDFELNKNQIKQLLDYITNLQTIEREYSTILSENAELQQEISRLMGNIYNVKEYIEKHRIREKCIVDVNTLEGLLNE